MSLPFAALEVRSPLLGTVTAVDTVFQRAAVEKLRLTADGPEMRAAATPLIGWNQTGGAANNRVWWMYTTGEQFRLDVVDDAKVAGSRVFTVDRTLNVVDSFQLFATVFTQQVGNTYQLYNVGSLGVALYERFEIIWTANIATLRSAAAGGGTGRSVSIEHADGSGIRVGGFANLALVGSAAGQASISTDDGVGITISSRITTATATPGFLLQDATFGSPYSAAAGTQTHISVPATINQSGTAGFVGLNVNVTPTSVGSGTVFGLQIQRGGTSVFQIDTKAALTVDGDTVMLLTYHSAGVVKHARVTLAADAAGQRFLQVAT